MRSRLQPPGACSEWPPPLKSKLQEGLHGGRESTSETDSRQGSAMDRAHRRPTAVGAPEGRNVLPPHPQPSKDWPRSKAFISGPAQPALGTRRSRSLPPLPQIKRAEDTYSTLSQGPRSEDPEGPPRTLEAELSPLTRPRRESWLRGAARVRPPSQSGTRTELPHPPRTRTHTRGRRRPLRASRWLLIGWGRLWAGRAEAGRQRTKAWGQKPVGG